MLSILKIIIIWKNGSFRNNENLQYLKTLDVAPGSDVKIGKQLMVYIVTLFNNIHNNIAYIKEKILTSSHQRCDLKLYHAIFIFVT